MAIQPIDLQTLFSQVDKVGKSQIALREGLAIQQDIEGLQIQKKAEERVQEVNKAQDQGDGVDKINDRREQKHGQANKGKKNPDTDEVEAPAEAKSAVIRDPSLGKNIDISL
ncbi:MAG: hypothetical protein FWF26_04615 [Treponema sp.]|nr:hypothetical protein [Treponema sp.]